MLTWWICNVYTYYMGCKQKCWTAAIDGIYCLGKFFFFFSERWCEISDKFYGRHEGLQCFHDPFFGGHPINSITFERNLHTGSEACRILTNAGNHSRYTQIPVLFGDETTYPRNPYIWLVWIRSLLCDFLVIPFFVWHFWKPPGFFNLPQEPPFFLASSLVMQATLSDFQGL